MNANELKIRNYVLDPYNSEIRLVSVESSAGQLTPIKLTEETALRLGFEKDNSENNKTYLSPAVNGSRMKIYFNRFGVAIFTMNMFHRIEIKNVHTLQNLFFALYSSDLVFLN